MKNKTGSQRPVAPAIAVTGTRDAVETAIELSKGLVFPPLPPRRPQRARMRTVFADAAYWIAMSNPRHSLRTRAKELVQVPPIDASGDQ